MSPVQLSNTTAQFNTYPCPEGSSNKATHATKRVKASRKSPPGPSLQAETTRAPHSIKILSIHSAKEPTHPRRLVCKFPFCARFNQSKLNGKHVQC